VYEDVNLNAALEGSASDNLTLRGGDRIAVVQASNWHRPWVVQVRGEAMRPGPYVIYEGETLASVLQRCGGVRSDGYFSALVLTRQSVKRMQEQSLKRASAQIQTELTKALLMPAETTQQQQQINFQDKAAALSMLKNMITQSGEQQAIGRVVLNVSSIDVLPASRDNLPLEDNDQIIVPKRPSSVNVTGEVFGAGAISYDPALTVADYIDRAGGLTQDSDKEQIFVVKANGAILSENGIRDSGKNRIFPLLPLVSGGLMQAHLAPGDTVYVPVNFVFVNPLQRTMAITQIVANTAQGIAYAALLGTLLP
jgi:protein involved in polysaccharide export with SLBB domain